MRNGSFSANRVAGIRFVIPHVRTGRIHAEIHTTLINDKFSRFPIQSGIIGHIFRLPIVSVILGRIEKNRIAFADLQFTLFELILDLLPSELRLLRNIADIQTNPRGDALVQGQLIDGFGLGVSRKMAYRIYVGWTVITEHDSFGLIGKPGSYLPLAFIVRKMSPDNRFQMSRINGHPLVDFL